MNEEAPLAFPLERFPQRFAEWVEACSTATQTPTDLAGVLALSVMSAAVNGKVVAMVKRGWCQPLNLYAVVGLPSGERKSAVLAEATRPLYQHEDSLAETTAPLIVGARAKRTILQAAARDAQNAAVRAGGSNLVLNNEVVRLEQELAAHHVPVRPQLVANDVTPSGLARLLHEQGERIALMSDEAEIVSLIRRGIDLLLKGYDAHPFRSNRATSEPILLNAPSIVLGAAIQPDVVGQLVASSELETRGLLARICFVLPHSRVGKRNAHAQEIPSKITAAYGEAVRDLLQIRAEMETHQRPVPNVVVFDDEARSAIDAYQDSLERRLADGGDLESIRRFALKHAGRVARIAALLHVAKRGLTAPVDAEAVANATVLGHYFLQHAKRTLASPETNSVSMLATRILGWIQRSGMTFFSRKMCMDAVRAAHMRATDLDEPLQRLEHAGYIAPAAPPPRSGAGRPVGPYFQVLERAIREFANSANWQG